MDVESLNALVGGVAGLLIGSFLNVVIYRLPKMMERQWAADFSQWQEEHNEEKAPGESIAVEPLPTFNLLTPRSACPACGHQVRWYENIPVLSFLALRGQCSACKASIGVRYPLVELLTGALFAFCTWQWGMSLTALAWCGFSAALVALAFIDWDTTLLPDDLTLSLLWAGLLAALMGWTQVPLADSVWGATAGYLSLWSVYWAFKLITGKEGMGYGDFKLLAALGAWFGWQGLLPIILMASVIGAVIGIILKLRSSLREGGYVPFGPFLAGAGAVGMLAGPQAVLHAILRTLGL